MFAADVSQRSSRVATVLSADATGRATPRTSRPPRTVSRGGVLAGDSRRSGPCHPGRRVESAGGRSHIRSKRRGHVWGKRPLPPLRPVGGRAARAPSARPGRHLRPHSRQLHLRRAARPRWSVAHRRARDRLDGRLRGDRRQIRVGDGTEMVVRRDRHRPRVGRDLRLPAAPAPGRHHSCDAEPPPCSATTRSSTSSSSPRSACSTRPSRRSSLAAERSSAGY